MPRIPEKPHDGYESIYLDDTDRPLPEKINQSTRYIHFNNIATGGESIIARRGFKPRFRDDVR